MTTKLFSSVSLLLVVAACMTASYVAPNTRNVPMESYSRVINKSFDKTWSALIQYSGTAFFAIDNFEKESGLLTLSFGASRPADFVTGGHWKASGSVQFDGDYVDYMVRNRNGNLQGKMNIIVVSIDSNRTRVTVKARYIFTSGNPAIGIDTWSFDSGGYDTRPVSNPARGTQNSRTLMPTYKAEKAFFEAIQEIN